MPKTENAGTRLGTLPGGTNVIAASLRTGQRLLTTVDAFVDHQSRFDRQARLNLDYRIAPVSLDMYFNYISSQVMAWAKEEIAALKHIMSSIRTKFARIELTLPSRVYLVKTTGLEEGYAAYTRQMNVITLPHNMVASLASAANWGDPLHDQGTNLTYLENVIIHECFHLFSKNNPHRREELYALVNYRPMGNEVELPEVPWGPAKSGATMRELKITNPDTPVYTAYIEMKVPTSPRRGRAKIKRPLLPILLANKPYDGGVFFQYLQWWFMAIEQNSKGNWMPVLSRSKPVLYDSKSLMRQYLKLVGRNLSGELFHPDEILAQNFVFVANQPSTALLERMGRVLN